MEAIHQAVFYERGDIATGYFPASSPWHAGLEGWKNKHDPDKAKFLLKQAKYDGTPIQLMAADSTPYMRQTGDLIQDMWTEAGFKIHYEVSDSAVVRKRRRTGDFHVNSAAGSYRFDPDGWFSRQVISTSPLTQSTPLPQHKGRWRFSKHADDRPTFEIYRGSKASSRRVPILTPSPHLLKAG